jgi:hypothetical protein
MSICSFLNEFINVCSLGSEEFPPFEVGLQKPCSRKSDIKEVCGHYLDVGLLFSQCTHNVAMIIKVLA